MRIRSPHHLLPGWLVLSVSAAAVTAAAAPRSISYPTRTMGTYANVTLVTADSASGAAVARAAERAFQRVDSLMSNWTTTSEVARINREAAAHATVVEPEVARVIDAALQVGRASGGAFDITVEPLVRAWGFLGGKPHVPDSAQVAAAFERVGSRHLTFDPVKRTIRLERAGVKIDLGGIAKGHAVDEVRHALESRGVENALVDLSGNMYAMGHPPDAPAWRIGIRDPRDRLPYFARLQLTGRAIATSGKYEQFVAANGRTYGHIMDPRTGAPAEGLISVTVLAPDAMTADAWGTALFVLGPAGARRVSRSRADLEAVLVVPGPAVDTVYVERSLADRFVLDDAARGRFVVVPY
jgi:FAD:protein FMN transferase